MTIGTDHPTYRFSRLRKHHGLYNGAYFYAKEIEDIILPKINHSRVTIVTAGSVIFSSHQIPDRAIIVCHHNINPVGTYGRYLNRGMLWITSKKSTMKKLKDANEKAVYIPLSIDTKYVKKFRQKKTKDIAFVGNKWGFKRHYLNNLPDNIDQLYNLPREELLTEMAKYKTIIAEGRCNIEAQVLGCKVKLPSYGSGIDVVKREVVDSREVIDLWKKAIQDHQKTIDKWEKTRIDKTIRVTRHFRDLTKDNYFRRVGQVYTVDKQRANELIEKGFAEELENCHACVYNKNIK